MGENVNNGLTKASVEFGKSRVYVIATKAGVSQIFFGKKSYDDYLKSMDFGQINEGGEALKFARELEKYLAGKLTKFKTRLDITAGTSFQRAVWKKLLDVPYGQVVTYKELAEAGGSPGAARAVGNAVGKNPLPIVIPCHRVLAANGLGGYTPGVGIKKDLLKIEGVIT